MFIVTFWSYWYPELGREEYYEENRSFSHWEQAEEFINGLDDYEFKAVAYHFGCCIDEVPF